MVTSRRLTILLLVVVCLVSMFYLDVPQVKAATTTEERGFEALSFSETYSNTSSTYATCWNGLTGTKYVSTYWEIGGQLNVSGFYQIWRTILYFDSRSIPYDSTIDSAILSVYVTTDNSTTDFNFTVQTGSSGHPTTPPTSADYNKAYYSGDGGSRNTSDGMTAGAWWNISLSSTGLTWINESSNTVFMLRSDRDISGTAPSVDEYIIISSWASANMPRLYVTYTYDTTYTFVTRGAYYENGTIPTVNTTITLYKQFDPPETRVLNATAGVEDVEYWYVAYQPYYFTWNITDTTYNRSRSYWLTNESFENIYIFIPDPDTNVYEYTFTVNDIAGITDAYLETDVVVNGYVRYVERKRLDTINGVTFWMSQGHRYSLTLLSAQGTYEYGSGFEAGTVADQALSITKFSFPITYSYQNVSISAVRVNSTTVQVYYFDNASETTSLNVSLTYFQDRALQLLYSSITTSNPYTLLYIGVDPNTDYIAEITATKSSGDYKYKLPLAIISTASGVWSGLDSLFPDSPVPVSNFFGLIIIFVTFGILSYWLIDLAMILCLIENAVFVFIGWMNTPVTILTLGGVVIVFAALRKGRERRGE